MCKAGSVTVQTPPPARGLVTSRPPRASGAPPANGQSSPPGSPRGPGGAPPARFECRCRRPATFHANVAARRGRLAPRPVPPHAAVVSIRPLRMRRPGQTVRRPQGPAAPRGNDWRRRQTYEARRCGLPSGAYQGSGHGAKRTIRVNLPRSRVARIFYGPAPGEPSVLDTSPAPSPNVTPMLVFTWLATVVPEA